MSDFDAGWLLWHLPGADGLYDKYMQGGEFLHRLNDSDRLLFWMLVYKAEGKRLP